MGNRINWNKIKQIAQLVDEEEISSDEGLVLTLLLKGMSPNEIMNEFHPEIDEEQMTSTVEKIFKLKGVEITRDDILEARIQNKLREMKKGEKSISRVLEEYIKQAMKVIKENKLRGKHNDSIELLKSLLVRLRGIDTALQIRISEIEAMLLEEKEQDGNEH